MINVRFLKFTNPDPIYYMMVKDTGMLHRQKAHFNICISIITHHHRLQEDTVLNESFSFSALLSGLVGR